MLPKNFFMLDELRETIEEVSEACDIPRRLPNSAVAPITSEASLLVGGRGLGLLKLEVSEESDLRDLTRNRPIVSATIRAEREQGLKVECSASVG